METIFVIGVIRINLRGFKRFQRDTRLQRLVHLLDLDFGEFAHELLRAGHGVPAHAIEMGQVFIKAIVGYGSMTKFFDAFTRKIHVKFG